MTMTSLYKELAGANRIWRRKIPFIQLAYNSKVAAIHGSTPFSLMFGRRPNKFADYTKQELEFVDRQNWLDEWERVERVVYTTIKTRMECQQAPMQETECRRWLVAVNFETGTVVFATDETRISKLQAPYEGPFTVVGQDGHRSYILKDGTNKCLKRHFPAHMLKLAKRDNEGNMAYDVDVLEVGHILGARATSTGSYDYLVKLKPNIPHIIEWNPCWVEGGS